MLDDKLLTLEEAAEMLGMSESAVKHWMQRGYLPVVKLGTRFRRYSRNALQAWIDKKLAQNEAENRAREEGE
jgi:excisionase family DNA binding protein